MSQACCFNSELLSSQEIECRCVSLFRSERKCGIVVVGWEERLRCAIAGLFSGQFPEDGTASIRIEEIFLAEDAVRQREYQKEKGFAIRRQEWWRVPARHIVQSGRGSFVAGAGSGSIRWFCAVPSM